jgi:hypothetical protein
VTELEWMSRDTLSASARRWQQISTDVSAVVSCRSLDKKGAGRRAVHWNRSGSRGLEGEGPSSQVIEMLEDWRIEGGGQTDSAFRLAAGFPKVAGDGRVEEVGNTWVPSILIRNRRRREGGDSPTAVLFHDNYRLHKPLPGYIAQHPVKDG